MKSFVDAIKAAEISNLKKDKFAALSNLSDDAKLLMIEAFSPYRVFGVKKWRKIKSFAQTDADISLFTSLLNNLHDRVLTGNAARDAVEYTLSQYTEETSKYLTRVILKDLKAGFSPTTLHKIYPALVPSFNVMLAEKVDEKFQWIFPIIAEAKYDGVRMIAIVDGDKVSYLSRSGKPHDFCNGLFDDELINLSKIVGSNIIVDGEALATNFTETLNAKASDNDEAKANLKFYAFDVMTLDEWKNQRCDKSQTERSKFLEEIIKKNASIKIIKSKYKLCNNFEEVKEFYDLMLSEGYEGLIIKRPEAKYEWDRSKAWAKWKPVIDVDLQVVGFELGRPDTKWKDILGYLIVEGKDENGNFIKCHVGSGFTDEQRAEIYNNKHKYLGKIAEIQAQELSKSAANEDYSLRFPTFIRWRDDK